ncbi:MAG: peptidyl-prolyl cis-trans isomerase [Myxococcota bacterium]|nr:peptidyl-prolyl cis-trans isomerase [Myxococcota bacterium]
MKPTTPTARPETTPGKPVPRALWRSPALHFVLLGALVYVLDGVLDPAEDAARRVVMVPAPEVERIALEARRQMGREPSPEELDARIAAWVDEELLVLEARALGWHLSDPVVQRRLIQNARFLAGDTEAGDDEMLERAFELGLDRSDLVVRRRLAARMRLAIAGVARATEPTDAELEEVLRRQADRFREPARVRLSQVFLSRDRRGAALVDEAADTLERLRQGALSPEAAAELGDPSLLPAHLPSSSRRELAARFGPDFGAAVMDLVPGDWRGPVPSSYGLHLVWVHERRDARDPPLDEVRDPVRATWLAERERQAVGDALARLRERAEIRVEGRAPTRT